MAERILRSPGVTTREIDLSAPGTTRPQGVPAGIIGTAEKGPAFVPTTFATFADFTNKFGATKGKHFGVMAVREWMRNARSGLFLRVLGVGDGNKADAYGATARAGFLVGDTIKKQEDTTLESDGAALARAANPFAGAGELDKMPATKDAGTVQVVAAEEKTAITPTWSNVAAFDGEYFIIETIAANGTKTKRLFWLSAQATDRASTPGARTITGQKIVDGAIETDLSATGVLSANIHFVDLTDIDGLGATANSANDVANAIKFWVNKARVAGGQSYSNIPNAELDAVSSTNSPVLIVNASQVAANAVAATAAYGKDNAESSRLTPSNSTGGGQVGRDAVAHVVHQTTLQFNSSAVPVAGTTLTINDGEGATRTFTLVANADWNANYEIDIGTHNTPAKLAGFLFTYLTGGANAAVAANVTALDVGGGSKAETQIATAVGNANMDGASGTPALLAGNHMTIEGVAATATVGPKLIIRQSDGSPGSAAAGTATPSVTVTEVNPAAKPGRLFFLGAKMHTNSGQVDYFGRADQHVSSQSDSSNVLRGVIMFASGVLPGLAAYDGSKDSKFEEPSAIPASAFTAYGTGQNEGGATGRLQNSNFVIFQNGFNATLSGNPSVITGSVDPTSPIYFGKVLNTDPTKLQETGHYLYASYDIPSGLAVDAGNGNNVFLLPGAHNPHDGTAYSTPTSTDYKPSFENWQQKFEHGFTPWITSQTLGNNRLKLFRFHMLDAGAGGHGLVKISIANIQKSTDTSSEYGQFDVLVRSASDLDSDPIVLQSFMGVNLNPASDRYIARVIGDQNTFFEFEKDEGKQKLVTEGLYPNNSDIVRVQVVDQIESGMMEPTALPCGFQGKHHLALGGKAVDDTIELIEPPLPFRQNVSVGAGSKKVVDSRFYWGTQYQSVTVASERNKSAAVTPLINSLTKWYPTLGEAPAWVGDNVGTTAKGDTVLDANVYNNNEFTLENIWVQCKSLDTSKAVDPTQWHEALYIRDGKDNTAAYKPYSGSVLDSNQTATTDFYQAEEIVNSAAAAGAKKSKSAANGWRYLDVAKDFGQSASKKFLKFTVPMQGGFDGLDIFDKDKSEMNDLSSFREMDSFTSSDLGGPSGPTTAAFRKALDILAEKSDVDIQLLATPGMRSAGITDYAVDKTEDRFDALYIMDMPAYDHDSNRVTLSTQETSVTNTTQELANRNLDTSFAAVYFPDIVIQDGSNNVVSPPSVAVIGAMSLNDSVAHPWYAPAGFARGALTSTLESSVKLSRANMDVLYDADINPITSFPERSESVVIFGQKTLLQAQSALDRVNVRRLLIDIRRKVRTVANQILFEPNREATLNRFSSLVNPILSRIQQQQGLDRYKVIIDTTTTTQQDVENNTIRGKIFLQPTRSIEFISLDFVVTNAGAEI